MVRHGSGLACQVEAYSSRCQAQHGNSVHCHNRPVKLLLRLLHVEPTRRQSYNYPILLGQEHESVHLGICILSAGHQPTSRSRCLDDFGIVRVTRCGRTKWAAADTGLLGRVGADLGSNGGAEGSAVAGFGGLHVGLGIGDVDVCFAGGLEAISGAGAAG